MGKSSNTSLGGSQATTAKAALATAKLAFKRARKGANLSRKQVLDLQRKAAAAKTQEKEAKRKELKKKVTENAQRRHSKKSHVNFDRYELQCVQDGLIAAIEMLGAQPSALSLFMCARTALGKAVDTRHIPYILSVMTACVPRLSQGVLQSQLEDLFTLLEQVSAEHSNTNQLVASKAMKCAQEYLLHLENLDRRVIDKGLKRLEPSKLNDKAMSQYVMAWRKLLERAALTCTQDGSLRPSVGAAGSGTYALPPKTLFFLDALPTFVELCISSLSRAPFSVAAATFGELKSLFQRAISPYIVESVEGRAALNTVLSTHLLNLFKAHYQPFWPLAAELVESLYDRLSYLKRTNMAPHFMDWFPSSAFFVKVLNKLRHQEDTKLNGKVERAMVAIGKAMPMSEFVALVPFDPREVYEKEKRMSVTNAKEYEQQMGDLWADSYFLGVVRRTASHDSLPFFIKHYYPQIQFCVNVISELEERGNSGDGNGDGTTNSNKTDARLKWSSLLLQYWRIGVGFCHYPIDITKESFRDLAKQLVSLFSQAHFVDTAATALHVLCDGYYQLYKTPSQEEDEENAKEGHRKGGVEVGGKGKTGDDMDEEEEQELLPDDERAAKTTKRRGLGDRLQREERCLLEEDDYYLSLNDPGWNPHVYHNISQRNAQRVCEDVFAPFSSNIMPKLCNTFEKHDSTAVLLAIQSFSKVCNLDVMNVILRGILSVGVNISREGKQKQAVDGEGSVVAVKAGNEPLTSKRRMILDLACVVVGQCSTEQLTTLFNDIVEPVLSDPAPSSRLLQKKAYKLLYSMFEYRVKDVFHLFPRIAALLAVGQQYITVSGVRMRIRCLSWALDACKMFYPDQLDTVIRGSISEVILFSRERSSGARELAMEMLEKMQRYIVGAGGPVSSLLYLVMAAFSGKTPMMMSSALVCMAKVLHMVHAQLPARDLEAAIGIGFRMLESVEQEVRAAAATFARMIMKLVKRCDAVRAAVSAALPKLLFGIALVTSQSRVSSSVRLQMRILLSKCIKRFSLETVDRMFPLGSRNFLLYTNKLLRREEKRDEHKLRKRKEEQSNEFDQFFLSTAIKSNAANGDAVDLLQEGGLSQFVATHTEANAAFGDRRQERFGNDEDDQGGDDVHLEFSGGKLRILTRAEKQAEMERERRQEMARQLLRRGKGLLHHESLNEQQAPGTRSKRGRAEEEDFENEELVLRYGNKVKDSAVDRAMASYNQNNPSATNQKRPSSGSEVSNQIVKLRDQKMAKRELKRQRVEGDIRKGEEFAGRGQGDVKSGNLEPFAYVPLNRRFMNRRHQRLAVQRFESVSSSILKGNKAKMTLRQGK